MGTFRGPCVPQCDISRVYGNLFDQLRASVLAAALHVRAACGEVSSEQLGQKVLVLYMRTEKKLFTDQLSITEYHQLPTANSTTTLHFIQISKLIDAQSSSPLLDQANFAPTSYTRCVTTGKLTLEEHLHINTPASSLLRTQRSNIRPRRLPHAVAQVGDSLWPCPLPRFRVPMCDSLFVDCCR